MYSTIGWNFLGCIYFSLFSRSIEDDEERKSFPTFAEDTVGEKGWAKNQ